MNKELLVKEMAKLASREADTDVSQKVASACLNAFMTTVEKQIGKKQEVALVGFGTFKTAPRAERKGRNPRTKEELIIPATTVAVFRAGKDLKEAAVKAGTAKAKGGKK